MNKNTLIALGVFVLFALLILSVVPPPASVLSPSPADTGETLVSVYEGVTLCADCPGIETRLTLVKAGPYVAEGTYELSMTYIDRDVMPVVTQGLWTTERGTATDPDATVYAIDPDIEGSTQRYVRVDADTIRQLDGDGNAIPAELPFDLDLVQGSAL